MADENELINADNDNHSASPGKILQRIVDLLSASRKVYVNVRKFRHHNFW